MHTAYIAMNLYFIEVTMCGYSIRAMNFYCFEVAMCVYGIYSYELLLFGGRDVWIPPI